MYRRTLAAALPAAAAVLLLGLASSASAATSNVRVTHALPLDGEGTRVDVYVGAAGDPASAAGLLIDDFEFGETEGPVAVEEGDVTVYLAAPGADDDGVLDPSEVIYQQNLAVPAGLELSAVASFTEAGSPQIAVFVNDLSELDEHQGRLSVRHAAAAPPVHASVGVVPWSRFFKKLVERATLANGEQADLDLWEAKYDIGVSAGSFHAGVRAFALEDEQLTIVYATGVPGASFSFVVDEIEIGDDPAPVPLPEPLASSHVRVTHALPLDDAGTLVDVLAGAAGDAPQNAGLLIDDFFFGQTEGPVEIVEGDYTIYLAVPTAWDDGVLDESEIVYEQDLFVPGGLDLSAVASFTEAGAPQIAVFVNELDELSKRKSGLSVRHAAAAPEVTVTLKRRGFFGRTASSFEAGNGDQADLTLRRGRYAVRVAAGDFEAGTRVIVPGRKLTIVYAAGVPGSSFAFVVDRIKEGDLKRAGGYDDDDSDGYDDDSDD